MIISVKRKNYYRTEVTNGNRVIGFLISRPKGYQLHTNDRNLRWFKRRYFKSPADLISAIDQKAA